MAPAAVTAELATCERQCPSVTVDDAHDPELPAPTLGLACRHDDSVTAQSPLVVRCAAHGNIAATSLSLRYQSGGGTRFKDVPMRVTERGWWKAVIPADDVTGKSVRLYVDGRNASGKRLRAALGDAGRPTSVSVRPAECRCLPPKRSLAGRGV